MEALIGIGGLACVIFGMISKDFFLKGRNQATIKTLVDDVEKLKETMITVEKANLLLAQTVMTIQKDHLKIDETVTTLNESINKNNQALASLEATMGGLKQLLQNIFDGNLKITG